MYSATKDGFRIYIQDHDPDATRDMLQFAQDGEWHINWIAMEEGASTTGGGSGSGSGSSADAEFSSGTLVEVKTTSANSATTSMETIDFHEIVTDPNNEFDLSTDRFTPTTAGKYLVNVHVNYTSMSDGAHFFGVIGKNGVAVHSRFGRASVFSNNQLSTSYIVDMNGTTDYIDIARNSSTGNLSSAIVQFMSLEGSVTGTGADSSATGTSEEVVSFKVSNTTQDIPSLTVTDLDFATVDYNNLIDGTLGANSYTVGASEEGTWVLSAGFDAADVGFANRVRILVNGDVESIATSGVDSGNGMRPQAQATAIIQLNEGDVITWQGVHSESSATSGVWSSGTFLQGARISGGGSSLSSSTSGTGYDTTLLLDSDIGIDTDITLSQSWRDFDALEVYSSYSNATNDWDFVRIVPLAAIKQDSTITPIITDVLDALGVGCEREHINLSFVDDTTLRAGHNIYHTNSACTCLLYTSPSPRDA